MSLDLEKHKLKKALEQMKRFLEEEDRDVFDPYSLSEEEI